MAPSGGTSFPLTPLPPSALPGTRAGQQQHRVFPAATKARRGTRGLPEFSSPNTGSTWQGKPCTAHTGPPSSASVGRGASFLLPHSTPPPRHTPWCGAVLVLLLCLSNGSVRLPLPWQRLPQAGILVPPPSQCPVQVPCLPDPHYVTVSPLPLPLQLVIDY